jgi:hypothetical protein
MLPYFSIYLYTYVAIVWYRMFEPLKQDYKKQFTSIFFYSAIPLLNIYLVYKSWCEINKTNLTMKWKRFRRKIYFPLVFQWLFVTLWIFLMYYFAEDIIETFVAHGNF